MWGLPWISSDFSKMGGRVPNKRPPPTDLCKTSIMDVEAWSPCHLPPLWTLSFSITMMTRGSHLFPVLRVTLLDAGSTQNAPNIPSSVSHKQKEPVTAQDPQNVLEHTPTAYSPLQGIQRLRCRWALTKLFAGRIVYDCACFSCLDWHMPGNTSSLGFYKTKSFTQKRISEFTDSSFFSTPEKQWLSSWAHHLRSAKFTLRGCAERISMSQGCSKWHWQLDARAAFSWGPTHLSESQAWRRAFRWQETPFSDRVSLWSWHLLPKKLSMNASPWRYKIGTEVKHLLIRSHVFTLEQPIDVHRVLLMNDETVPAF